MRLAPQGARSDMNDDADNAGYTPYGLEAQGADRLNIPTLGIVYGSYTGPGPVYGARTPYGGPYSTIRGPLDVRGLVFSRIRTPVRLNIVWGLVF